MATTYNSVNYDFTAQVGTNSIDSHTWNADKTKLYICESGTAPTIYQYSASPAGDLGGTITYDNKSYTLPTNEQIQDFRVEDSGTKLFVSIYDATLTLGARFLVRAYTLSTADDISTASSVYSEVIDPIYGIAFKPDGTIFYYVGSETGFAKIFQKPLLTPWDLSTAVTGENDLIGSTNNIFELSSDGKYLFYANGAGDYIAQAKLVNAWDITERVSLGYVNVDDLLGNPPWPEASWGFRFSSTDEDRISTHLADGTDIIFELDLDVPRSLNDPAMDDEVLTVIGTDTATASSAVGALVGRPSTYEIGDVAIIWAHKDDDIGGDWFVSSSLGGADNQGFTLIDGHTNTSGNDQSTGLLYKVLDGTEGSTWYVQTTDSDAVHISMILVRGVDPDDPLDGLTPVIASDDNTATPSVTIGTGTNGKMCIACIGSDDGNNLHTHGNATGTGEPLTLYAGPNVQANGGYTTINYGISGGVESSETFSWSGGDTSAENHVVGFALKAKAKVFQDHFRGRDDDGTETGATWKAAIDTDWDQNVDENFRVRFLLHNYNGGTYNPNSSGTTGTDFRLEYRRNKGTWAAIGAQGTSVEAVVAAASTHITNGTTTQQLGATAGWFTAGTWTETNTFFGVNASTGLPGYDGGTTNPCETEAEICLQILSSVASADDIIELRVAGYDGTDEERLKKYDKIPVITVTATGPKTGTGSLSSGSASMSGSGTKKSTHTGTGSLSSGTCSISGAGVRKQTHTGTGALSAGTAVISGAGALLMLHTGTGSLDADAATIAGAGIRISSGTGALSADVAAIAGAGNIVYRGTGALTSKDDAYIAGVGVHNKEITGTGALVGGAGTGNAILGVSLLGPTMILGPSPTRVAGSGELIHSGTGSLLASDGSIAGSGKVAHTGAGALTAGAASISGVGELIHTGTGSLSATGASISGAGTTGVAITGSGALLAGDAAVSGAGELIHTGSGTLSAGQASIAGAGTRIVTGAGALSAGQAAIAGAGHLIHVGSGALSSSQASVAGAGTAWSTLTGAGSLQASDATIAGTGSISGNVTGTGSLQSGQSAVSGQGELIHVGSGSLDAGQASISGAGLAFSTHSGTGALASTDALVSGAGVRGSVGTGSLAATDAAINGAGDRIVIGSGALTSTDASIAGTGHRVLSGTGALASGAAQVSGAGGISGNITGTGSLAAGAAAVSGAGEVIHVGAGALAAGQAAVSGAGSRITTGTGALQAGSASITGVGVKAAHSGTGALQAGQASVNGAGNKLYTGSGALSAGQAAISGTGSASGAIAGSGSLIAEGASVSGSGTRISVGFGALTSGDAAIAGTGAAQALHAGTGSLEAGDSSISGAGRILRTGSGALSSEDATINGSGRIYVAGTGDLSAGTATVDGQGEVIHTGSGSLDAGTSAVAGSGKVTHFGAGDLAAGIALVDGAGLPVITGTGALEAGAASIIGLEVLPDPMDEIILEATITRSITLPANITRSQSMSSGITRSVGGGASITRSITLDSEL